MGREEGARTGEVEGLGLSQGACNGAGGRSRLSDGFGYGQCLREEAVNMTAAATITTTATSGHLEHEGFGVKRVAAAVIFIYTGMRMQ